MTYISIIWIKISVNLAKLSIFLIQIFLFEGEIKKLKTAIDMMRTPNPYNAEFVNNNHGDQRDFFNVKSS